MSPGSRRGLSDRRVAMGREPEGSRQLARERAARLKQEQRVREKWQQREQDKRLKEEQSEQRAAAKKAAARKAAEQKAAKKAAARAAAQERAAAKAAAARNAAAEAKPKAETGAARSKPPVLKVKRKSLNRTRPVRKTATRSYPAGSPAAVKRRRRQRRRLLAFAVTLVVVGLALLFSTNVIFKVGQLQVENLDRTVPADTGIYTEQQIIRACGIEEGTALFAVNGRGAAQQILISLPYLEEVHIRYSLPDTVAIQVKPAHESLYIRTTSGYAVLSDTFRVLKLDSDKPEGLIELRAKIEGTPQVGYSLALAQVAEEENEEEKAMAAEENATLAEILARLAGYLQQEKIYGWVTQINLRDLGNISVTFRDRVEAELGTANNLDYKCRMLGIIMRNEDGSGISDTDRGTLDLSRVSGTGRAYFTPE